MGEEEREEEENRGFDERAAETPFQEEFWRLRNIDSCVLLLLHDFLSINCRRCRPMTGV